MRADDTHGDELREEEADRHQAAMGLGAQAALGDGVVGGVDGRAAMAPERRTEASEAHAEVVSSDEEMGLAPGESD